MHRVPYVTPESLPPPERVLLARPINLFRALANSPGALKMMHGFGEWIRFGCELDARVRELVILQVGYLARNRYEFSHHVAISRAFGVTDQDLDALVDFNSGQPSGFAGDEELFLRAASQIASEGTVDDATWSALEGVLSPARLVDLVTVVAHYSMVVRVIGALRIENESEYERELERFEHFAESP